MTTTSGLIASMLRAVSSRVSPLVVELDEPEMLTASAERRLAAISNDVRVRVDASRNRFTTVFPRRVGTFLIGRWAISRKRSPRSRIVEMSALASPSIPSRWRWGKPGWLIGRLLAHRDPIGFAFLSQHDPDRLLGRGLQADPHEVGMDGQLPATPVDQGRQLHRPGSPVVSQDVHGRADGSPGVQHVVDQHDGPALDRDRQVGRTYLRLGQPQEDVVPVERDVDRPQGWPLLPGLGEHLDHPLGQESPSRPDADEVCLGAVPFEDLEGHPTQDPGHPHRIQDLRPFDEILLVGGDLRHVKSSSAAGTWSRGPTASAVPSCPGTI